MRADNAFPLCSSPASDIMAEVPRRSHEATRTPPLELALPSPNRDRSANVVPGGRPGFSCHLNSILPSGCNSPALAPARILGAGDFSRSLLGVSYGRTL